MATVTHRHFSPAEIARLESGLSLLHTWSEHLLVPFTAYRLRHAALVWINRPWFRRRGFDLDDAETHRRIESWLLDEFGFAVRRESDPEEAFTSERRTLFADRYGSTDGLTPHGGSGRVATIGCFQAKGVGQTPLVGQGGPAGHTHGCIALAECVREAIFAEISAAEFPCGAIPTIAIIDPGLSFSSPNSDD